MADWDKWDGQSWYRNNKNRPSGVGTVSQSRRERVRAKAIARDQAALAAARAQAAPAAAAQAAAAPAAAAPAAAAAAAAPAAETATPCQKELGPSNAQLAAEKESSTSTSTSSSSSSSLGVAAKPQPKKPKVEEDGKKSLAKRDDDKKHDDDKKNEEKKESLAKRDGDQKDAGKNEKSLAKRGDQKNAEEKKSSQKDVKMEVSKKDSRNKALDKRGNSWQETGHGIWLQEAPSSSTSGITLAKSEQPVPEPTGPKWVLKANNQSRVAIDYHQCLEIQEHVPPKNVAALHGLAANGYQVFLVSYAGQGKTGERGLDKSPVQLHRSEVHQEPLWPTWQRVLAPADGDWPHL